MTNPAEWFKQELASHHQQFVERKDYFAFLQALLLCCWNHRPLPDWVADIVVRQADDVFAKSSTGPGKHGNWRAIHSALEIDKRRAALVDMHLQARRRHGRVYVSELAVAFGYGKSAPGGGANIVTRNDIFKFVANQLKGTPERGSACAVEDSYKAMRHRRRRRKRGAK